MKVFSLLEPYSTEMEINPGIEDLKKVFNSNPEKFHFEWLTENSFFICLNFSIGSSLLIDTNYGNKKSSIVAYGTLSKSSEAKTKIILETKSKQWLLIILLVPLLMLALEYFLKLGIPLLFIFAIIIGIFGLLIFIRVEEKRLIENFHRFIQLNLHSVVNKLD